MLRDIRKKVGLVFQYPEYQLFEETVAKDVAYGPKNMGMTEEEIQQRVREALDLVDLPFDEYGSRSPFELSGGQKRRAAIAGVIAMEPEVLILDEPTAGLDPATHRDILDMICRIREQRGTTVIFVSHNMDDIARLCDRVLVMDEGQLVMTGTPAEVFAQSQKLKDIGLGIPEAGELIEAMRRRGAKIGENALFPEEAAEIIGRYFRRQTGADGCVMRADAGDPSADTGARRVVSEAREPDNGADIKMEEPDNSDDRGTETC